MQPQEQAYSEITYEQLAPLPENTDFSSLPSMLIPILTCNQWEQQLQALTFLRQLNKQYPSQVFNVLQIFYPGITQTLSGSPKVSKYVIQVLTEMLQNTPQCQFIGFGFAKLMEALLLKTLNEQKSVALLAQNLLSKIILNEFSDTYDNFLMMFIELIYTNKNVNVAENAVKALAHLIASKGLTGLQSLQMENLGKLIQFIAKLTVAKRKVFQSYAAQIANFLFELTGEQVFSNFLTNFLQEEDQQNMIKAITSLKTKSNQGTQLSMQLRQHIREVKKSHIVNNNMKEVFGNPYEQNMMPLQQINLNNLQNMQNNYSQQQDQNQKNNNFNYSFGANSNENNIFYSNQQQQQIGQVSELGKQQQFSAYQMQQNIQMNQFMN